MEGLFSYRMAQRNIQDTLQFDDSAKRVSRLCRVPPVLHTTSDPESAENEDISGRPANNKQSHRAESAVPTN